MRNNAGASHDVAATGVTSLRHQLGLLAGFRAHADHRGTTTAIIDGSGSYTFGELWESAGAFAHQLRRRGVRSGDYVGIAMEGSAAYVAVVVGIMLAGAAAAPLNTALTPSELARYLELLGASAVVGDRLGVTLLPGGTAVVEVDIATSSPRLADRLGVPDTQDRCAVGLRRPSESAAMLFPTGGTTGLPKAVVLSHRSTLLWALSMAGHGRAGSGVELFFLPFFHIGLLTCLLSTLHAGGSAIVDERFDPERASEHILIDGATRLQVVPTHLQRLRDAPTFERARHRVRDVRFGGMASAPDFVDLLLDLLPNATLSTGYGATEFGPVTVVTHDDLLAGRRRGVGRPVPGARVTILGSRGTPAAPGEPGDVVVSCPWQASKYVGQPEGTESTFTAAGVRLADTGCIGEDGWLTLLGRTSDMLITGGENVFPAEIEAVLSTHPDIADVVVLGVPDGAWGERVEAAIVVRPGATMTVDTLRDFARGELAPYKLPRSVRLLDRIPLTPNNKPDRRALRATAEAVRLTDVDHQEKE